MLVKMHGKISHRGNGYVILDQGGCGYKILVPDPLMFPDAETTVYLHEVVREDERVLFGFSTLEALELFWKLTTVSGVGPKTAQKIIFADDVDAIRSHIMTGNLAFLTGIGGIGKKIAQKIILELKGALVEAPSVDTKDEEALQALVSLGYPRQDAQEAIKAVADASSDTEMCLRNALKMLSRT
jgi:Holliday junction DNA helicase RuvA